LVVPEAVFNITIHYPSNMVSMWGSSKKRDGDTATTQPQGSGTGERSNPYGHEEPTERTRLLSDRREGYLDPDDPSVSSFDSSISLKNPPMHISALTDAPRLRSRRIISGVSGP
jgi:hypothetical protein